ncbi:hypothetical protein C1645_794236 [Glomus cerebriforme]|uniref:Uncharacterized protein n=1 Tax=Glomus cerebriforme TaxID=658196 RepID=A0A397S1Z5_9GLOM|nr:hypothetical protein C1645_794236 [Glomus cerebriforme]
MIANYSFYTLPALVIVTYYLYYYKGYLVVKQTGKWNNINPRDNVNKAKGQINQEVWRKAKCCEAAHQNVYNSIYINNESAGVAGLRTFFWTTSMGISFALYILVAKKAKKGLH